MAEGVAPGVLQLGLRGRLDWKSDTSRPILPGETVKPPSLFIIPPAGGKPGPKGDAPGNLSGPLGVVGPDVGWLAAPVPHRPGVLGEGTGKRSLQGVLGPPELQQMDRMVGVVMMSLKKNLS